jgi:hypothetical protein
MKRKFIVFVILFLSCTNPFSTRNPEEPTNRPQLVSNLQNNPDSLLVKLQHAFRDENINFYMDCLADSHYTFIPEQNEAPRIPQWTLQDEFNYFNRLINNNDIKKIILQIYNVQTWNLIGASQDTLQSQFNYEIEVNIKANEREIYQGESIFKIFRSQQSLWYIYYWEDLENNSDETDSTWSTLKVNYR